MARTVGTAGTTAPRRTVGTAGPDKTQTRAFRDGASEGTGRTSGRGMNAWKNSKNDPKAKSGGDFNDFTVDADKKYIIAFLEDGPLDPIVWVHWVPTTGERGSYNTPRNCPTSADEDAECPLCVRGIEAKPVAYFNVVDLDEPGKVYLWKASKDPAGRIEELFDELQALPSGALELNSEGVYAVVSKAKQKNGRFAYKVARVKERDLGDDYGLAPLTDEQFQALEEKLYTAENAIRYSDVKDLKELADAVED